jgi:hypothetical protein
VSLGIVITHGRGRETPEVLAIASHCQVRCVGVKGWLRRFGWNKELNSLEIWR